MCCPLVSIGARGPRCIGDDAHPALALCPSGKDPCQPQGGHGPSESDQFAEGTGCSGLSAGMRKLPLPRWSFTVEVFIENSSVV